VLAPEDLARYDEVAMRVAASRWSVAPAAASPRKRAVAITTAPRAPGETCLRVVAVGPNGAATDDAKPLAERCTYGVVWPSALRWSASGTVATLAVQPLAAWTELWVVRKGADQTGREEGAWTIDPLTPATTEPQLGQEVGYVESAGFSPDGAHLLVVREARVAGRATRKFQVLAAETLAVEIQCGDVAKLSAFKRWQAAWWKVGTLALR
ncbi:MAG: hypothetical protein JWM82_3208, partial [Myxococcales bacterium]|nr:hypothetical protein [Myxococcales bacterium]